MSKTPLEKIKRYAEICRRLNGLEFSSVEGVTESVIAGLAKHLEKLNRPLCPCNFYKDKKAEIKRRRWLCPCNEMQMYKYCHCLLYVTENNFPVTEHLPENHEGRQIYGLVPDPHPELGRPMKDRKDDDLEDWYNK